MKNTNIYENIPKDIPSEIFEDIITKENLKIQRIISKGHVTPKSQWYNQTQDEWVLILKGEAILSFQTRDDVKLSLGDYFNIPAHTKHKVSWTTPNTETIWLAIHY